MDVIGLSDDPPGLAPFTQAAHLFEICPTAFPPDVAHVKLIRESLCVLCIYMHLSSHLIPASDEE